MYRFALAAGLTRFRGFFPDSTCPFQRYRVLPPPFDSIIIVQSHNRLVLGGVAGNNVYKTR